MGKDLYETHSAARLMMEEANRVLGFNITDIMFNGTTEQLRETRVTQPAVFIYSVASFLYNNPTPNLSVPHPTLQQVGSEGVCVAGHSLGEFSALVAAGALSFEDGLRLVYARAMAMQACCEQHPGTMAAVINLPEDTIEQICSKTPGIVVAANYNCPGQVVISGEQEAVAQASETLKAAGAKRVLPLAVGGAFHSPLMEPARQQLAEAILRTEFHTPKCPIYQNVDARPHTDIEEIRTNLLAQLTAPVRWTDSVMAMHRDGVTQFEECGPGNVLTGLIGRII